MYALSVSDLSFIVCYIVYIVFLFFYTADPSIVLYLVTVILLEKEVLKDMTSLMEWKNKKDSNKSTATANNQSETNASSSKDMLPDWANTTMFQHFQNDVKKELMDANRIQHPMTNPMTNPIQNDANGSLRDEEIGSLNMMSNPMGRKNTQQKTTANAGRKKQRSATTNNSFSSSSAVESESKSKSTSGLRTDLYSQKSLAGETELADLKDTSEHTLEAGEGEVKGEVKGEVQVEVQASVVRVEDVALDV